MFKKTDTSAPQEQQATVEVQTAPSEEMNVPENRSRDRRKTTYERVAETKIPKEVEQAFAKEGWDLKWVRFKMRGEEDYRNLAIRFQEGYEFVQPEELPQSYRNTLQIRDACNRKNLVTSGDCCLMRIDQELREDRRQTYMNITDQNVDAVDMNVISKKKGFKNLGSKSQVMTREPTFRD